MALLLSSCFGHKAADPSEIVVDHLVGHATIQQPGEQKVTALGEAEHVPIGSVLHLDQDATIRLVRGKSAVDILPYDGAADLHVTAIDLIDVSSGYALVRNDPTAPVGVSSRGITARTQDAGIFRFDRELGHDRVGVYSGNVTVSASPVDELQIEDLRQGDVSARELPNAVSWYKYQSSDSWDTALLGDVMQIDTELEARERGYLAQFGAVTKSVASLSKLAPPGKNVYFVAPYLKGHDSAELLVAVVFSFLVDQKGTMSPDQAMPVALDARAAGATWGELARAYGVEGQLVDSVLRAIQIRTGERKPGTVLPSPTPTPSPSPTTTGTRPPSPTPTHSPSPTPTHSPSPSPSHSPSPSPTPSTSKTGTPLPTTTPSCLVLC